MIGLVVILIVIGACLNVYLVLSVVKAMAAKSFTFTIMREGTAKAKMTAGATGAFSSFLLQYTNREFKGKIDPEATGANYWEVVEHENKKPLKISGELGLRGIRWLGMPRFVEPYQYKFRGLSFTQEKDGTIIFERKDEKTDYVDVRDNFIIGTIKDAEDAEMVPLTIVIVLGFRICNPFKALFKTESSEWLKILIETLIPVFRKKVVAIARWQEIQAAKGEYAQEYFKSIEQERDKLKDNYGLDVSSAEIQSIDVPDEIAKVALKPFVAEREKKVTMINADAEAYRRETVWGKTREFGDLGELILRLETFKDASQAGKLVIVSAPELTQIAKKAGFSQESAEELATRLAGMTPEEIAKELGKLKK